MLLPNKVSCSVSKYVSSDNSFPSARQEPTLRPWKGVPLPATASYLNMVSSWPERSRPWFHEAHIQWIKVFLKEKTSWLHYYTIEKNQHRSASLATQFSSVAQSCLTLCDPMDCSMPGFPVHHQLNSCPSSQWCHPTISSPVRPLLLPSIFSSIRVFSNELVLHIRWLKFGVSASASVLPMSIEDQIWFPLGWLVWSPYSPRDSQESSPTPQLKNINSPAFSFLYSPTLTGKTTALTTWTFVGKVMSLLL